MTEEIRARQTPEEARIAVESGQRADIGGARRGAESRARQINRYLYENLVANVEGQIEYWNRRASRESNPQAAVVLRHKAEGLGYALRLLNAFQPEFQELVMKAENRKCQGCGVALEYRDFRQASDSDLCDSCAERAKAKRRAGLGRICPFSSAPFLGGALAAPCKGRADQNEESKPTVPTDVEKKTTSV